MKPKPAISWALRSMSTGTVHFYCPCLKMEKNPSQKHSKKPVTLFQDFACLTIVNFLPFFFLNPAVFLTLFRDHSCSLALGNSDAKDQTWVSSAHGKYPS